MSGRQASQAVACWKQEQGERQISEAGGRLLQESASQRLGAQDCRHMRSTLGPIRRRGAGTRSNHGEAATALG